MNGITRKTIAENQSLSVLLSTLLSEIYEGVVPTNCILTSAAYPDCLITIVETDTTHQIRVLNTIRENMGNVIPIDFCKDENEQITAQPYVYVPVVLKTNFDEVTGEKYVESMSLTELQLAIEKLLTDETGENSVENAGWSMDEKVWNLYEFVVNETTSNAD